MTSRKPFTLLGTAAVIPLAALAVAGCGSGSGSANASTQPTTTAHRTTVARHVPTVHVATTRLGKVLVNSRGRTLYLFTKDSGTKSACSGACATAWPPLRASGKPTAGSGARASLLRTTAHSQVTYNRHPLYTFIKDTKAGQTNGEGVTAFGGHWFAVSPAGKQVSPPSTSRNGSSPAPAPAAPAPAAPAPAPAPAPAAPAPQPSPPANNGIPQNNGGDGDADNNGGPSDGDGGI
jgi:predicted lipoprotein with Yx(FWY)xxD motif